MADPSFYQLRQHYGLDSFWRICSKAPLMRMTAVAHYAEYRLQDSPRALWVPKEVDVRVELGYKYVFSNRHRYSDYRLFRVKSVIKTNAPGTKKR